MNPSRQPLVRANNCHSWFTICSKICYPIASIWQSSVFWISFCFDSSQISNHYAHLEDFSTSRQSCPNEQNFGSGWAQGLISGQVWPVLGINFLRNLFPTSSKDDWIKLAKWQLIKTGSSIFCLCPFYWVWFVWIFFSMSSFSNKMQRTILVKIYCMKVYLSQELNLHNICSTFVVDFKPV